uniref:protein-tyrosine-phosphatase n=1 Tax=Vibrio ziniensis TaxID=2711221 RepID=A0A6G7CQR1_9VIBR|nr:low molecular weight protein-tyrosine-phosphatase [Vibrio ziniensis]QIH44491.1 low molecular weight phosphotyrosine protein phosphatase [Vibrio ziniensis]
MLVICTGNICRSPYGEYKLRKLFPELTISSAGLDTDINRLVGKRADSVAVRIAEESQIDLRSHRAKQLTEHMLQSNDFILVMEAKHMESICDTFPSIKHKVFMFSHWVGATAIEDPYKRGELNFRLAFTLIDDAAEAWVEKWRTEIS